MGWHRACMEAFHAKQRTRQMQREGTMGGLSFDLVRLREGFQSKTFTALALIEEVIGRLDMTGNDGIWITRASNDALRSRAAALDHNRAKDKDVFGRLPLFGIP